MKIINKIIVAFVLASALLTSCTGSFDELNTDPTRLDEANPGTFLNPILYNMTSYNWKRYNDYTFALMQSKVSTSSTNGLGWYYVGDAAGDGTWSTYYKWLNNIREMEKEAVKLNVVNYQAVSITLRSWIFQLLTDAFGNVPMTEACRGDEQLFTPKFDTQEDIYHTLIDDLATANTLFDTKTGLKYNTTADILYKASSTDATGMLKWKKFCNSLRMRILMRVIDVNGFNAAAELKKMIDDPTTYPVFTSNEDAAMLSITGVAPEEAPLTRPQDFTAYLSLSEFFINHLVAWNDPRLPLFATKAKNDGVSSYVGLPSGYAIAPSINASQPNQAICKAPMKLAIMTYSEVEFIKAELAQRSIIDPSLAQTAYENGVKASVEQWGGVMPANYFANAQAAYNGTLERIMEQKFFALFFVDYQQWFEHNRTGLPVMPRGDGVPSGNVMPKRLLYPAVLQRTNLKNYQEAKAVMGGDELSTKLMWQK